VFLLAASARAGDPEGVITKREVIQTAGQVRMYTISYLKDLDPKKPVPLIVAFHGYRGDVKTWFYEESVFPPLMAKEPFVIAYPEGPVGWEPGKNTADVRFFDGLVADLEKKYPIDPARVYVVGHSNGAVFASFLLMARPNIVAAAVAHSGLFPASPFPQGVTKSPLLVIWGEKDHMAPADSDYVQLMTFGYRSKDIPVTTIVVPGWGHPWAGPKNQIEEKVLAFLFSHRLGEAAAVPVPAAK
jgi:poly(3-hydroxybutyrate) depolymerase